MEGRSYFTLTTGNGRNFTLVDARTGRVTAFLDHPYRYLGPGPDPTAFGIERRNLLADLAFSVDGAAPGPVREAGYVEETHVVRVRFAAAARLTVVSPFGLALNAVLIGLQAPGAVSTGADLSFRLGLRPVAEPFWKSPFEIVAGPGDPVYTEIRPDLLIEQGPGEGTLLYRAVGRTTVRRDGPAGGRATAPVAMAGAGPALGFVVAYLDAASDRAAAIAAIDAWVADRDAEALVEAELDAWRAWRRPVPGWLTQPDAVSVWRQSEAVLRMGQVRETAADGMILASLAPGEWSIGWVRDGCYAIAALATMGHHDEARRALRFLIGNRRAGRYRDWVGGIPYRISVVRYYGDGQEEADYAGHATPNIETDGWGLVLWATRILIETSGDAAWLATPLDGRPIYDILREEVAEAIAALIETEAPVMRPDCSIWEVHQENARHFLYTSVTAARGLADFAWLAGRCGRSEDAARHAALAEAIAAAIPETFRDPATGHLRGARESSPETDIDGAAFELYALGVATDPEAPVAQRTYAALETLRVASGGYRRSAGGGSYASAEWGFVNLRAASVAARRGRLDRARQLLDLTTARAVRHFGLIPETYDVAPAGRYSGSIPMVGYGAGLYILAQTDLAIAADAAEAGAGSSSGSGSAAPSEPEQDAFIRRERE
ncbi:hypothetical protein C2U72_10885 [Prosthecomicrobium hirschii]|uniref:hypothetical protein n=1 Tax=Prosthecodimorpha hirschii TaxID=665126 RepID=UPI00112E673A|nr:hypothetical protein [Prosthecomicrobium hirschii]TPQ50920.1 hypothetical protein C2U72_10885 [Prosthecomicrobium hirschii]